MGPAGWLSWPGGMHAAEAVQCLGRRLRTPWVPSPLPPAPLEHPAALLTGLFSLRLVSPARLPAHPVCSGPASQAAPTWRACECWR